MGSLYRSEEMTRCQLYLQTEAAYTCVAELGELGLVQFRDLNPDTSAFQRKFVNEVRRCDEMERKLRFLEKEIRKDEIPMLDTGENPDAPQPREMIDLEATYEKLENELREVNSNAEMLKKNFLELTELKHILRKTQAFFDENEDAHALQQLMSENGLTTSAPRQPQAHRKNSRRNADMDASQPPQDPLVDTPAMRPAAAGRSFSGLRGVAPSVETDMSEYTAQERPNLNFVAGVILREKVPTFERLLWRACRGNVFLRQAEITEPLQDPVTNDEVHKCVFIIFFQGEQLKTRVKKICEGFRATLYPCPDTPQERREMAIGVMTRIEDLKQVLGQTQDHRHRVLVAAAKNVRLWFTKVRKIKAIYHTLNLFNIDVSQKALIAECWCPVSDLDKIQLALKRGTEESGSTVPSILHRMESADEQPPTFFRTNKFTSGFQNIVDAYGVATYQEINPAPYTVITFPFLFAVMFGDTGHGIIMMLFALFLVLKERVLQAKKIQDEIFQTFFGGRYIILLMGIFSIYTGLIYNDIFAKAFNIFGFHWDLTNIPDSVIRSSEKIQLDPNTTFAGTVYPFGIDPIWQLADNKLLFLNSFKMKMSVIVGVIHMLFGIVLGLMNHRYFKRPLDIYFEFIPRMVFLTTTFFYLCILIFHKWTWLGIKSHGTYPGSHCSPSLLVGLINMFMFKSRPMQAGEKSGVDDADTCYLMQYYSGQQGLETAFILMAILTVPVMLFGKTLAKVLSAKRQRGLAPTTPPKRPAVNGAYENDIESADGSVHADNVNGDDGNAEVLHHESKQALQPQGGHGDEPHSLGDEMIHQAIHTIEFCLGCISHTASYLRLWALSLAHAELSEVLWSMVMRIGLGMSQKGYTGTIAIYAIFAVFGCLTVAILVMMEGLSAFLHALRLHWVEFNSKFYTGEGYSFMPFSFDKMLEQAQEMEGKEN